jgi:3',5'-cyclic AMP phosphodiesterase CpdA
VVVVSDSHLTARLADSGRNWSAALRYMESSAPDLVVHVGDLSMDGAHDAPDLAYGRAQMDKVPAPWRVVPGNHDIGDTVSPHVDPDDVVTAGRLSRWCGLFGPDHWTTDLGAWHLVGVNAQLFGTSLPAEADQWDFLEHEFARSHEAERRVLLVVHKPVAASDAELAAAPPYRFVTSPARERLWERAKEAGVAAVLSGHVHQSRSLQVDGVVQLWAPTTWAVLPEAMQRTVGAKRCGLMELELSDDGPLVHRVVEPDGMAQLVISEGVPYPPPHWPTPTSPK